MTNESLFHFNVYVAAAWGDMLVLVLACVRFLTSNESQAIEITLPSTACRSSTQLTDDLFADLLPALDCGQNGKGEQSVHYGHQGEILSSEKEDFGCQ